MLAHRLGASSMLVNECIRGNKGTLLQGTNSQSLVCTCMLASECVRVHRGQTEKQMNYRITKK